MLKYSLRLFYIFFRVGAFTFGGGHAMIPVIQKEIVDKGNLLEEKDFLDIIGVSQCLPGAVAVNTSVFVGFKLYGLLGAIFALLGTMLPSMIVITIFAIFYTQVVEFEFMQLFFKGVRPAIVSLIFVATLKLSKPLDKNYFNFFVMGLAFFSIAILGLHPILVIVSCGVIGLIKKWRDLRHGLS